jgi:hypothetical protein
MRLLRRGFDAGAFVQCRTDEQSGRGLVIFGVAD